jgi:hypothetical protein
VPGCSFQTGRVEFSILPRSSTSRVHRCRLQTAHESLPALLWTSSGGKNSPRSALFDPSSFSLPSTCGLSAQLAATRPALLIRRMIPPSTSVICHVRVSCSGPRYASLQYSPDFRVREEPSSGTVASYHDPFSSFPLTSTASSPLFPLMIFDSTPSKQACQI